MSDDRRRLRARDPDPSPTKPDLEPVCQPVSPDEQAPPPPTLHSRSHRRRFAWLSGPQGRRPVGARVWVEPKGSAACASPPGKGGCYFFSKKKVLMQFCTRRAGQCPHWGLLRLRPPPVPITAPVLASKGPRGQLNSGTDSHLPPHQLYSWEGRERVLGQPASRPSGPDRAWQ